MSPRFIGPNGGQFSVRPGVAITQDYIDAMVKAGQWTPVETPTEAHEGSGPPCGKPLAKRTVAELKAHATEHGIDLAGATKKPEILAAILAATTTTPTGAEPQDPAAGTDPAEVAGDADDPDEQGDESHPDDQGEGDPAREGAPDDPDDQD